MRRLVVEQWAPEFGSSLDLEGADPATAPAVDLDVERCPWSAVTPAPADDPELVAFVDGVRRVEARLTLDDPEFGPVPGVLGAFAVGAALWRPRRRLSTIGPVQVGRSLVIGEGAGWTGFDRLGAHLGAGLATVPGNDPAALVAHVQGLMRSAEGELAAELGSRCDLVLADGPLRTFAATPIVGYIKSQRTNYLPRAAQTIFGSLDPGQRTPLFAFAGPRYPKWSWYLRLAAVAGGHSWSGIVRCEASGALPLEQAVAAADATARLLPRLAPPAHVDTRAPQNLVPIGALESHLRHLLGDSALAWRRVRGAAHGALAA